MENITLLNREFIGTGDVRGFKFRQIAHNDTAYLYEISVCGTTHYEVFQRIKTRVCLDFKNKVFSETDFIEKYPKSNKFGITAWTYNNKEDALLQMKNI